MEKPGYYWTEKEINFLQTSYPSMSMEQVKCSLPGRSKRAIHHKTQEMGIKKSKNFWDKHIEKLSESRIASHKIDALDTLTQEKAYWLGFIYADGCLNKNYKKEKSYSLSIAVALRDKDHLERIENVLPNPGKYTNTKTKSIKLSWSSYHLATQLINLGVHPRKSLTLKWPTNIDRSYLKALVLGYFDGDGSIYISKSYKKVGLTICGNKEFLLGMQKFIQEETGVKMEIYKHSSIYRLDAKAMSNIVTISEWMYSNAEVYLPRKKIIADQIKFIHLQRNTKGKHTVADFSNCKVDFLDDMDKVVYHMETAAKKANATVISSHFHKFSPVGISGAVILAESNLCVHIWKEERFMSLDIFTCGDHTDPRAGIEYLKSIFKPETVMTKDIKRGSYWAWDF